MKCSTTFQRFMDQVLRGIPFAYVYIDDVLVASTTPEEHLEHLRIVFERLAANGIVVNPNKCVFGVNELDFLGHHIDCNGITPLQSTVQAVTDFPQPTSQRQLRRFIQRNTQVPQALATATHVFVRHDAVRKPLQSPYDGPYPVLERTDKFFKLNIKGREDTVSIDRLKPAYLDINSHPNPPPQSQTHSHSITAVTRPGRQVHWSPTVATYVS